jgi:hypothetical protein
MWCFFARQAAPDPSAAFEPELDVEPIIYGKSLRELISAEPSFSSALGRATILMAIAGGHIEL